MVDPRYITITVQCDREPEYGRSLEWIAPELKDSALTMTEDISPTKKPHPLRREFWADRPTSSSRKPGDYRITPTTQTPEHPATIAISPPTPTRSTA